MDDNIIKLVFEAQSSRRKLNRLIEDFLPFIKSCVAKTRGDRQSREDGLTIAMLTFADCVKHYSPEKGSFISFTQTAIRNRLIDDFRGEIRFSSRNVPIGGQTGVNADWEARLSSDEYRLQQERLSLSMEIEELSYVLSSWNTSFQELSKLSPKQKRTRAKCEYIAALLLKNKAWRKQLIEKHRMPTKEMCEAYGVSQKILEKYRIYIAAVCIIQSGDYPMLKAFMPTSRSWPDTGGDYQKGPYNINQVAKYIETDNLREANNEAAGKEGGLSNE